METCQSAALASPKALWDRGGHSEEIRRIFIILWELYLNVTCEEVVNWIASEAGISSLWECGSFSPVNTQSVSLSARGVWGNKDRKWKWAAVIMEVKVLITVNLSAGHPVCADMCAKWGVRMQEGNICTWIFHVHLHILHHMLVYNTVLVAFEKSYSFSCSGLNFSHY